MSVTWTETRFLSVPLEPAEIQARGEQLAKALEDAAALEVTHKAARDLMREDLGRLEAQIHRLAHIVRARVEERSVLVELRLDLGLRMVEEVRTDTGEIIKTRGATEEDKLRSQMTMPGTDGAS